MQRQRVTYRQAGRNARRGLHPTQRTRNSDRICLHIGSSPLWHSAKRVGLYFAAREEVDLSRSFLQAFAEYRDIFVPIVGSNGRMRFAELRHDAVLRRNRYGIWEPDEPHRFLSARQLDLVITPVVAFDDHGNRIGMGAGYYDRCFGFLLHREYWLHPKLVGAAFACQKMPEIPRERWDVPLYAIATEQGLQLFRH